jgi:hypothetical protein
MIKVHPYRTALSALVLGVVLWIIADAFFNNGSDGADAVWALTFAVVLSAAGFALYGAFTRKARKAGNA